MSKPVKRRTIRGHADDRRGKHGVDPRLVERTAISAPQLALDLDGSVGNGLTIGHAAASPAESGVYPVQATTVAAVGGFPVTLNRKWRIIDDPLQWILQQKKGERREKNSGWESVWFCRTREGLFRGLRERVTGDVDQAALDLLLTFPERHS